MSLVSGVKRLKQFYDSIIDGIAVVLFACITAVTFYQVVARYVFNASPSWSEELARYLMIWLVFVGAAIAYRFSAHLGVDYFTSLLPKKVARYWAVAIHLAVACILLVFITAGTDMLEIGARQVSSALRLPMTLPFLAVPVGGAMLLIENITQILTIVFGAQGGEQS